MTRLLIAAVAVAAAFVGCPAARPAVGPAPSLHPCAIAAGPCTGTIEVPLNWDDPGSERIEVAFQRIPRRDPAQPAAGTILVHMGGPPSPSIGPAERVRRTILEPLGPVHDHHDLVVADLRGLGASTPLACTGVDVDRPETVAGCGEQLGPRAGWFALDQAVRDYDAVRAALGVPRPTLFGNSWGSELAQAYASRFPDRTAAVFLNGAVPVTERGYAFPGGPYEFLRMTIESLDRACAAAPECAALPGSTGERLERTVDALRAQGADVGRLVAVLEEASFVPRVGRDLDAALQAHLDGDPAPLRRLTDAARPPLDRPELAPDRAATLLLYLCGGADLPFDRTAPPQQRLAQLDAFYAEQQPYAPFTREEAEAGSSLANPADLCAHWPWLRESAPVDVTARPEVPVLQVAGAADPTTVDAEAIGDRFPRHSLLRVPGGAHQTWDDEHPVDGWCVRDAVRGFLLDPPAPVDRGCDRTTFHPAGAFPRTADELPDPAAVAHATAVDATVPRHPADLPGPVEFTQAGVRGGTATGTPDGVVTLRGYRFVEDAAVDGTVAVDPAHTATAQLTVTTPDGPHRVELAWPLLDPTPTVTGTLDGAPITLPPAR